MPPGDKRESREVLKPRDLYLELSDRSEICDRHFDSIAADVPVTFQSDKTI